jgi:hypothetical protein
MKFAAQSMGGSNGQAAWTAVYGLMKILRSKGLLTDDDVRQVIGEAEAVAPSQPNARTQGAGEIDLVLQRRQLGDKRSN